MDLVAPVAGAIIGIVTGLGIIAFIVRKHLKGINEFCNLSPEDQLTYFGVSDLGHTISLKSYILPEGENNSLVYDVDEGIIYFIHGRALKSNRSYESIHKDKVLSYALDSSSNFKPIIIKTSKINQPIIRIICIKDTVAEELIAALDLIMSNQPLERFGQSMLKE